MSSLLAFKPWFNENASLDTSLLAFALLSSLAGVSQIVLLAQSGSSSNVSALTWIIFLVANCLWIADALSLGNGIILLTSAVSSVVQLCVIIQTLWLRPEYTKLPHISTWSRQKY